MCRDNEQHIFFILTKAFTRLLKFEFPPNAWIGVSSPPDYMVGKELAHTTKVRYLDKALKTLDVLKHRGLTTFLSYEPLAWNLAPIVAANAPTSWAIIGAGSNGPRKIQPNPEHVRNLLRVLDGHQTPVFLKENIHANKGIDRIRKEFPSASH